MKGIKICGECANYDYKKHRCKAGAKMETDARAPFYDDCPLPDVAPAPRWIPVTERLPEERGQYIVAYHPCYWDDVNHDVFVGVDRYIGGKNSKGELHKRWAQNKYKRVTHWMPLPEAPKEDT